MLFQSHAKKLLNILWCKVKWEVQALRFGLCENLFIFPGSNNAYRSFLL
jgi:hypothetical protein